MNEKEIIIGQQSAWELLNKLGEGDAGEVFLVAPLGGGQKAILKRPRLSAFTGDMYRQSTQIRSEAKILQALSSAQGFDARIRVSIPHILDQSKPGAEYNSRNFIILDRAAGLDLGFLSRVAQLGISKEEDTLSGYGLEDRVLVDAIARSGKIPHRLLINVLHRLTHFLDFIHTIHLKDDGSASGILWNDIKPGHLFWDAQRSTLTIIDWGNARFLEADLTTSDRQFSWVDDFRQLFEEMGRFLSNLAPDLKVRLDWPSSQAGETIHPAAIEALKFRLEAALQEETKNVAEARAYEDTLFKTEAEGEISLTDIQAIQGQIIGYGETPDFDRTLRYTANFAARLTLENRLDDLRKLCNWAISLPGNEAVHWKLVDFLARIPGRSEGAQRQLFLDAIQSAISREWENALWSVAAAIQDYPEPDWWHDLICNIRQLALPSEHRNAVPEKHRDGVPAEHRDTVPPESGGVRPFIAVRRVIYTAQALAHRLEDKLSPLAGGDPDDRQLLERVQLLICHLDEDVIANWRGLDPCPPDASLEYVAIEPRLAEAIELLPEKQHSIEAILSQPKAQVKAVLGSWEDKDFLQAARELRRLLLLDPDRWRVLHAERSILSAADWLKKVQAGPQAEDIFAEWITSTEFQARELRNQVGPASWLDTILESCKQIRTGAWPSAVAIAHPEFVRELPWLAKFERRERIAPLLKSGAEEDESSLPPSEAGLHGVVEDRLGPEGGISLIEPLDTWMAEARGSSARVVSGILKSTQDASQPAAIKLMRMDQVQYALPLFREEATILSHLGDLPGVSHLLECGFIHLAEGSQYPYISATAAPPAEGLAIRIGPDSVQEYLERIEKMIDEDWTPYLAVQQQRKEDSLLFLCDAGVTRGQYQPITTLLQMAVQICDILEVAHQRNIVYRDHKILHYYWQAENTGIYMIDWNVARYHPDGLTQTEIEMDIVQFGARGLHHILTGRTAPGALPLGPTRPEEIEQAAHSYKTQWTYDDQRLNAGLRSTLERVLAGEYSSIIALQDDLKKSLMQMPEQHPVSA